MTSPRPQIAYLINQYPMVSHSFIRREIHAIERQGFAVLRVALRGWDETLAEPQDIKERGQTRYVLRAGALPLLAAVARALLFSPARLMSALLLALRMGRRADRPLLYHLLYLAEACCLLRWLRACGAVHLHAHFCSNPAEIAMLVRVLGGPSYSFTVHGTSEFDKLDFLGIPEKVRHAAFVISVSAYGRSQIYRRIPQQEWHKVRVVHCGLEPSFHSVPASPPASAPVLVCVGRLSAEKGQLLLLQAAARLAAKGIPFNLVLAGDGDMRAQLEAFIANHGLHDRVRITGWISSEQVRDEILAARALVLPSFSEGLPVVIMEAMALRRPVLASCVGGIPELLQPGTHGWLFPAGDVDGLLAAMEDFFATSADRLQAMGEAAYQRVLERHSVDTEAVRLAALFRQAMSASESLNPNLN